MEAQDLRVALSLNLKKYRKIKGWSQFELAEKAEISEQTVNSIEGLRLWPSDKTLAKMAKEGLTTTENLYINKNSQNKELAYEYVNWRLSQELQSATAVSLNEAPTNKDVVLAQASLVAGESANAATALAIAARQASHLFI